MYLANAKKTAAAARFPGPAHPPRFAELPLDQLHVSPANVRAHGADRDLDGLVANIRAHGLIQPLVVRCVGEAGEDRYEVVAGQRRLLALRRLAEERTEERTDRPPTARCQIIDVDATGATAVSLSENVERLPMEPFDQCAAFRRLTEHGLGIKEIADRFGIPQKRVKQRLALAHLLDPIKELARDNRLSAEDAQALALVSAEKQRAWLDAERAGRGSRGWHLRQWLFGGQAISTKVALFALEDYPGAIIADLFGTERYFEDAGLFWVHQNRAVAIRQEELEAQGWERVIALEAGKPFREWEHRAVAQEAGGWAWIEVRHDGAVEVREGYLPAEEARRRERLARGEAVREEPGKPARGEVTQPMLNYLGLHKAAAVRRAVMDDPALAKRLAVAFLVGGATNWNVRADETRPLKAEIAASVAAQAGTREVERRRADAKARLLSPEALACAERFGERPLTGGVGYPSEGRTAALLPAALALDDAEVDALLAVAVADTLLAGSAFAELLGRHLNVDLRDTWTPDKAFVDLISDKAALQAIAAELGAAPPAKATGKELRTAIRQRLDGEGSQPVTGWLPGYLKFPFEGYAPDRPAPEVRAGCDALAAILDGSAEFRDPYAGVRFGPDADETGEGEGEGGEYEEGEFEDGEFADEDGEFADDDFGIDAEEVA